MGKLAFDNYQTPPPLADAITQFCAELFPQTKLVIEPSCGSGSFIQSVRRFLPAASVFGIDLIAEYQPMVEQLGVPFIQADFVQYAPMLGPNYFTPETLVLTNPPYSKKLPQRFIEVISQNAQPGCHIAFLLRQAFLGGVDRALRFRERQSLRVKRDIAGRPKFDLASPSQDHSEYAVYIYEVGYRGHYIGWEDPLLWKPEHLAKKDELLHPPPRKTRIKRAKRQSVAA